MIRNDIRIKRNVGMWCSTAFYTHNSDLLTQIKNAINLPIQWPFRKNRRYEQYHELKCVDCAQLGHNTKWQSIRVHQWCAIYAASSFVRAHIASVSFRMKTKTPSLSLVFAQKQFVNHEQCIKNNERKKEEEIIEINMFGMYYWMRQLRHGKTWAHTQN